MAIVGAGLAGLAAGCELADRGHDVLLLDRRPWAGGKTYSFAERATGEQVDNGQHIAMRCTTEYVRFLERIGTAHLLRWQPRMSVRVYDANGRASTLRADPLPAGLHMVPSFATYAHLRPTDKLRIARGILAIRTASAPDPALESQTFGAWLRAHGQTDATIRDFWDLVVVPALNCRCDDASAAQALFVFREGFLKSPTSAAVGVPVAGLTQLHVDPALAYIRARGGDVRTGASVTRIVLEDGAACAVELADGKRISYDAVIAAVPPAALLSMLPATIADQSPFADLAAFRTSPIVNVHLWFDRPVADFDFAAFTGCDLQWVFNRTRISGETAREEHVVISLSAAERYMPLGRQQLQDLLLPQLRRALPAAAAANVVRCAVIKEPDATFVPAPALRRPGARTPIANLFLAGAYTGTGWPATMESAVRSGLAAARAASEDETHMMQFTGRPIASAAYM
ncbi:MAG TPA: hydroxysqualene dehydroxylase HpnE [Dehalococcoidia bacterium]|nr:hydroxysqualene dehydroxylase HpnE [Dehalococcoidia bacterium]